MRRLAQPSLLLSIALSGQVSFAAVDSVGINPDADTIVISGSGFGPGPEIVLYDTFEASSANRGGVISLDATPTGEWTTLHSTYTAKYASDGRSGNFSAQLYSGQAGIMQQIQKHVTPTDEFFISYWVRIVGDRVFPGYYTSGSRTFSDDSSYKMMWLIDQDYTGDSSDVCLPTHTGRGVFSLAGNDFNMKTNVGNEWWSWDNWMRLTFWLKANDSNPTSDGTIHFDTISADKGYVHRSYNDPVFDSDGPSQKTYRQINFPGWVRPPKGSGTDILYDDIYISTGNNAAARVELGNAANLSDTTRLDLLNVESWSNSQIVATYPTLKDSEAASMYLYFTGADGRTSQQGIPVGGDVSLKSPPSAVPSVEIK